MTNTISVYDSIADKYSGTFRGENKFLDEFVKLLPENANVLDAGCGTGEDTKYLVSKGFTVESIDLSKKMITIARKNVQNHKFHLADIRKVVYPNNSFGGVVAAFSLIHLTKKESEFIIKKFHKFLKKEGIIYLALQEGHGEKPVKWSLYTKRKIFINFYTLTEIKKLLESVGFEIIFTKKIPPKTKYELQKNKLFIIAKKV